MINADVFRRNTEEEFKAKFDFAKFDDYINKSFSKLGTREVNIGLEYDHNFEKKYPDTLISFNYFKMGYWDADCSIPYRIKDLVSKYLVDAGFKTTCKGLPGFQYCVLIAML